MFANLGVDKIDYLDGRGFQKVNLSGSMYYSCRTFGNSIKVQVFQDGFVYLTRRAIRMQHD